MVAKKIIVVFFAAISGSEPVREWLKALSKEDRVRIGEDVQTAEFGWPVGMPVCRPLGQGLYEIRTRLTNRIARILFGIDGQDMVLLHGFIKKSQKTPKADLDLARSRLRDFKRRS